ncbi:MAG: hypothetical protein JWN72_1841 [Thermoleophilia bacterium]|nr:hypothetical protein [Thermoleophilia bacterium]
MRIAGASAVFAVGAAVMAGLGAASGATRTQRDDDGISGRDLLVTGVGTGTLGAAGLGIGFLVNGSQVARGVAGHPLAWTLVGGGVAAAAAAAYLLGWSATN